MKTEFPVEQSEQAAKHNLELVVITSQSAYGGPDTASPEHASLFTSTSTAYPKTHPATTCKRPRRCWQHANTIVPGGVQGLDRYAYTNNAPINYVDPTGHFTEEAVWNYAFEQCHRDYGCATDLYGTWKADTKWRNMLIDAQPGYTMFGTVTGDCPGDICGAFTATFTGEGSGDTATLTGMTLDTTTGVSMDPSDQQSVSLQEIQSGTEQTNDMGRMKFKFNWVGFFTQDGNGEPEFHVYKPGYTVRKSQWSKEGSNTLKFGFDALLFPLHWSVGVIPGIADIWGWGVGSRGLDIFDREVGDLQVTILSPSGGGYLNFNCPTCFADSRVKPQYFLEK